MQKPLRVAILWVALTFLRDDEISFTDGHFDGDVWVEPERRYAIGTFLKRCDLPKTWEVVSSRHSAVWIDFPTGTLRIAFTSKDFPETRPGALPPMLNVTMQRDDNGCLRFQSYALSSRHW